MIQFFLLLFITFYCCQQCVRKKKKNRSTAITKSTITQSLPVHFCMCILAQPRFSDKILEKNALSIKTVNAYFSISWKLLSGEKLNKTNKKNPICSYVRQRPDNNIFQTIFLAYLFYHIMRNQKAPKYRLAQHTSTTFILKKIIYKFFSKKEPRKNIFVFVNVFF